MGHYEAYSTRPEPSDSWETETVDILADLLLAEYTVETFKLLGNAWREVLTIGEPYNQVLITGPTPASAARCRRWWLRCCL